MIQGQIQPQAENRQFLILGLAPSFGRLGADARRFMLDENSGFNFVAMLSTRPGTSLSANFASRKELLNWNLSGMHCVSIRMR